MGFSSACSGSSLGVRSSGFGICAALSGLAGAAAMGAAYWWSTRWLKPVNVEAIAALPETVAETVEETVETLEAAALQLTRAERARLVDRLMPALDADPEVEEAWAAEVARRQSEIENGTISLLSGPEILTKLKAEF